MPGSPKYSPEVRERAARMVVEHRDEYPSDVRLGDSFGAREQYRGTGAIYCCELRPRRQVAGLQDRA